MRVLLVAPDQPGINGIAEVRAITSQHRVMVLNGPVSVADVYDAARHGRYDILHFAAHSHDRELDLSAGEVMTPEDVAQVGRNAGAKLIFFNSCRSGLLADYVIRHGVAFAIHSNIELPDDDAWKMPSVFYDFVAEQRDRNAVDYASAFEQADAGDGVYGLSVAIDRCSSWEPLMVRLQASETRIAALVAQQQRTTVMQWGLTGLLVANVGLSLFATFWR